MVQVEPLGRPQRNQRRQPGDLAAKSLALLTAALLALAVVGCGLGAEPTPEEAASATAVTAETATTSLPPPRQIQVVVDPSRSVPRHYLRTSLRALARAVQAIPKPLPANGPSPARPTVSITVRPVAANAYSPAARLVTGTIQGIPEISSLPEETDADLTGAAVAIGKQRQGAEQALEEAGQDADKLAKRISALDPPVTDCSDIVGAVSASAESFTSPDRRLVVISDLAQACTPNTGGSLQGVRVLIGHICEEADRCRAQRASWRQRLAARGESSPRFVRVENLSAALRSFVAGG